VKVKRIISTLRILLRISKEEIKQKAYSLFIQYGKVHGNDQRDWFEAERLCVREKVGNLVKNGVTFFTIILSIVALVPYGIELFCNLKYRPSITLTIGTKKIFQDKDGNWLADYNIGLTSNLYVVLPKKIFVGYKDLTITSNAQPSAPGGKISSIPMKNGSLAHVWDFDDAEISNCVVQPHQSAAIFLQAFLGKEKRSFLPAQIVIYAEVDPLDLPSYLQLFYHNRLYKGIVYHEIDFTGTNSREELSVLLT
jgi:hypothetical protein